MQKIRKNERTLTRLLEMDKRVYLYFGNQIVYDRFLEQAKSEGFIAPAQWHDYLALNNNMTFTSIGGWAGHMKVRLDKNIYVIDFARYINGAKDYVK